MGQIERAQGLIQARSNITQEIKSRTERLKQVARYRGAADTSPTMDSVAFCEGDVLGGEALAAGAAPGTGTGAARMPNVLAGDTWDLFRILLR